MADKYTLGALNDLRDSAARLDQLISYIEADTREARKIKVGSERIGEVVGDHTVIFDGKEEILEIRHHAKSRDVFARGALIAAKFVAKSPPGLYSMGKVLGISDLRSLEVRYG